MPISPLKRWIHTWLLVGSLDIGCAFLQAWLKNQTFPDRVLKFIASGIMGKTAFAGGLGTVALGLACHYFIAGTWVALFWLAARRFPQIHNQPLVSGIGFGCLIWLIMNTLVLPLSRTPPIPFAWNRALMAMLILILAVGIPTAWLYPKKQVGKTI